MWYCYCFDIVCLLGVGLCFLCIKNLSRPHRVKRTLTLNIIITLFFNVAKPDVQDLIPMVDVERSVKKDSIEYFCWFVEEYYGQKPVIYGTQRSYNSYLT